MKLRNLFLAAVASIALYAPTAQPNTIYFNYLMGWFDACYYEDKSCSIDYWQSAVNHLEYQRAGLLVFFYQPGYHQWCANNSSACAYHQEQFNLVSEALGMARNALDWWQNA